MCGADALVQGCSGVGRGPGLFDFPTLAPRAGLWAWGCVLPSAESCGSEGMCPVGLSPTKVICPTDMCPVGLCPIELLCPIGLSPTGLCTTKEIYPTEVCPIKQCPTGL